MRVWSKLPSLVGNATLVLMVVLEASGLVFLAVVGYLLGIRVNHWFGVFLGAMSDALYVGASLWLSRMAESESGRLEAKMHTNIQPYRTTHFINPTVLQFGVAFGLLLLLTYWGGVPNVQAGLFGAGVTILLVLIMLTLIAAWWLFFSPLPSGATVVAVKSSAKAHLISLALLLGGGTTIIAIFWDELWHRKYGVGTVISDFFWPPHVLLYASFALIALMACVSIYRTIRYGQGGLRQSVRAQPLISLVGLASSYLILSLPSDAIWHQVYGLDITAWSMPHLSIIFGFTFVMLAVAASFQSQTVLTRASVLAAAAVAVGSSMTMALVAEWEGASSLVPTATDSYTRTFFSRPEWLYPVVLCGIALFLANVMRRLVQARGAATLTGVLLVVFRLALVVVFDGLSAGMGILPYLLLLPAMVAIDVAALFPITDWKRQIFCDLVAGLAYLGFALPAIQLWMKYPPINTQTLVPITVFALLISLYSGWVGRSLGDRLASLRRSDDDAALKLPMWQFAISVGATGVVIALMIITAKAP